MKVDKYFISTQTETRGRKICFIFVYLAAQAYDQHLNMILGEVEETVTTVELDEETFEEIYKVCFNHGQLRDVISMLNIATFLFYLIDNKAKYSDAVRSR